MLSSITALSIDSVAAFLYQLALVYMKLAHQKSETNQLKSGYFQPMFLLGIAILILSTVIHACKSFIQNKNSVMLPFADLVLFTANSSLSIVFGMFLAVSVLGEKFMWAYDLPAVALMLAGTGLLIAQSSF